MKLMLRRVLNYFSPKKFSSSNSLLVLGGKFQEARQKKALSVTEVAKELHFSEEAIVGLETGKECDKKKSALFEPGYFRLAAVTYARFLELDLSEIDSLLPPPAPLKSSYTTFVKKLSLLQPRPQKPHFMREEQQLTYSLREVESFLWKFFKIIALIVLLFYLWNFVRNLARAFF